MERNLIERLMRILLSVFLVASLATLSACGGGGGGGGVAPAVAPGAFSMTTPVNNDMGVSLSPTLIWESSSGVATYTVQVSTDNTFGTITTFQTSTIPAGTNSVLASGLSNSTTYYWRVIAVNAGGATTASGAPYGFTTVFAAIALPVPPGAFSMITPTNGDTGVSLSPSLVWSSSPTVSTYTVQVTTDNTFSAITTYETTTVPAGTTSIPVSGLSTSTIYYWRVFSVNSAGTTTASSAPYDFTTKRRGDVEWVQMSWPSSFFNNIFSMKIDGTNMYLAGYDTAPGDGQFEWRMEKRNLSDGGREGAFGTTGAVVSNPTATLGDSAYAVAIDSNYMYVAGYDSLPGATDQEWRIEKRGLVSGLSMTFGTGGAVTENNSVGVDADDRIYAIAVSSSLTGTIYAAGFVSPSATVTEWRIEARSKVDGSLISGVTTSIASGDSVPNAIVISETEGYMYVVGSDDSGFDTKWRIEKRSLSAPLSLETTTFGGATGVVLSNPGVGVVDEAMAVALDTNYLYIAGSQWDAVNGRFMWRIEKRDRFTGVLETTTFGSGNGFVNSNTTTNAVATAIAIDAVHMYVAGYDNTADGSLRWRIEKRDMVTGALDTTFGVGGVYINDFGRPELGWDDDIWSIAVDGAYIYAAGSEAYPNTAGSRWRIEKIVK